MTDFRPTVVLPSLAKQLVEALGRKLLTSAAAALVTYGVLADDQSSEFVSVGLAILLGLASLAWSWWDRRQQRDRLAQAVAAPPAVATTPKGDVVATPDAANG